ncbi:MAG: HAMP domain-containing protein [Prevotella sp.]|nr:HAMP domain-containing protein [Prevotella sp.]
MSKVSTIIAKTLSFRLSLRIIAALALLLMLALITMFYFSRKAVREEALQNAGQTLEVMVENIDNVLLSVEQAAGNIYWKMMAHANQPELMDTYAHKLVECNPYITDSRIIWDVDSNTVEPFGLWTTPRKVGHGKGNEAVTFRLPFYDKNRKLNVLAIDVSLTLLSKIVLDEKPSPNSICALLGKTGTIIVYPDSTRLNMNLVTLAEIHSYPTLFEAAEAMLAGETGYKEVIVDGKTCYVFYKPFKQAEIRGRAMTDLGWSAGIIYPEEDIFGSYNRLVWTVFIIAVVGLGLLLVLCRLFIHHQLMPLRLLGKSAQHIADGQYDEPIPKSKNQDEVGRLQNHFHTMQQSLAQHMGELQQLSDTLKERGEVLQTAYELAQSADRIKTNFLYNMTDQMKGPVNSILQSVKTICQHGSELTDEETSKMVDDIMKRGDKVTALLNQLIADSERLEVKS